MPDDDEEGFTILDEDELDGLCDPSIQPEPVPDDDIDGTVLFADLAGTDDLEDIVKRKEEWKELFDGS